MIASKPPGSHLVLAIRVGVLIVACLFVASCESGSESSSTSAPSSAVPAPAPTTSVVQVEPELRFPQVDMGVATSARPVTLEEADAIDFRAVEEADDGAVFTTLSCVTTWPNRWEISGEWAPAAGAVAGPSEWIFGVASMRGDVIGGDVGAVVTLDGPGAFTIPMNFDPDSPRWRRAQETSHEYRGERPFGQAAPCQLIVASGPQPVVAAIRSQADWFVDPEGRFTAPLPSHTPGTLQSELETMTDPQDHWLGALSWHVGLENSLPVDVIYLRPDVKIDWIQITQDSTCVGVSIVYVDEVVTGQAGGCPSGAEPIDRFAPDELIEGPGGWILGAEGVDIDDLVPYVWEGADLVETSFDPSRYAEALRLPEDFRQVAQFEFSDGLVLLIEHLGDPSVFHVEELFTGGGEGYVGGGPGETWQGCWRVDYSDAGYAIVLTEDPDWPVTYAGKPVSMVQAGDVAAGLIEGNFDRPPVFHVRADPGSDC